MTGRVRSGADGARTPFQRLLLYGRTVRSLTPVQWIFLPLRRLQGLPRVPRHPGAHHGLADRAARLAPVIEGWFPEADDEALARAREVCAGRFRFLNHTEEIPRVEWRCRYASHLWSYNLHYFDYAVDLAASYRRTGEEAFARRFEVLATSWVEATASGRSDGWEPYALSLRIPNWLTAISLFGDALAPEVERRLIANLYHQADALERRLEFHIQANHLQKNYFALAFAGLFLGGAKGERWRRRGERGLWRELSRQVLPDGGHFERSPMYHAIALNDYLQIIDLVRGAGGVAPADVVERVRGMVRALGVLTRADGSLHLFNDAAHGIAAPRAVLDQLALRVVGAGAAEVRGAFQLPHTGYFGYCVPALGERILLDCGEPGPSYQPGHAHCDLLSFELDLGGRPVVVDSGVSGYEGDPLREYVRSTRAHNTVSIGGREQSEVWATFRMGRRARVVSAAAEGVGEEGYRFRGAYRPYHDARALHVRTVERKGGDWVVRDVVRGAEGPPLRSYVHLHPDFHVVEVGERVVARAQDLTVTIEIFGVDRVEVRRGARAPAQGWYCPEFGRAVPAPAIELVVDRNDGREFGYRIARSSS